ncbi:ELWxxDGT repeat protein [Nocardioides houyundeii]|uniref:ELWxxDGT repeat protein n=1 Tax=Nocardioides houyundeii TaxID=2045452 RepID=UPI000DF121AE|nr:ELWxxDGT repeat protein [Nocardioides houyundeii]
MTTRQRQRLLRRRRAASTRNRTRGRALVTGSVLGAAALVVPAPAAHAAPGTVPSLVADISQGRSSSGVEDVVALGARVFFSARDGSHGRELWTSDGTPGGTRLVKDIYPGVGGYVDDLAVMGGTLYFRADSTSGSGLWKSDGTAAGTTLVAATPSSPRDVTVVGGTLFFTSADGTRGRELWASDGTTAGTRMVADINPLTQGAYGESSDPYSLTAVGGTLFFSANDGTRGRELWASDGTAAGTRRLTDRPGIGAYDYELAELTDVGGTLYFTDADDPRGQELWTSDGTAAGTRLVVDLYPGAHVYDGETYANSSSPSGLTDVGGDLYFGAWDSRGPGLWRSDGTAAGTTRVAAVDPGSLTPVGGTLFFNGWADDAGRELWTSDGTTAGTRMAVDLRLGAYTYVGDGYSYSYPNSSSPRYLTDVGGTLFFSAYDGTRGRELWMSDGTLGGTGVFDLWPGADYSDPDNRVDAGGTLFFTANDGVHGHELWAVRPDGSLPPGTPGVLPAPPVTTPAPPSAPAPPTPAPPAPVPQVAPPDTRVVGVTVLGKTKQRQGKKLKISVKARAAETVTTTATGKITAKGLKGVALKPAKATSTIGQLGILDLVVSKKLAAKVKKALKRYRRAPKAQRKKLEVKAVVQLVITDAAGNKQTETRRIQLR